MFVYLWREKEISYCIQCFINIYSVQTHAHLWRWNWEGDILDHVGDWDKKWMMDIIIIYHICVWNYQSIYFLKYLLFHSAMLSWPCPFSGPGIADPDPNWTLHQESCFPTLGRDGPTPHHGYGRGDPDGKGWEAGSIPHLKWGAPGEMDWPTQSQPGPQQARGWPTFTSTPSSTCRSSWRD